MTKTEEKKRIEADKRMQAIKEKYLTMKKYATNIHWDTDGDKDLAKYLPQEICIDDIITVYDGTDENDELISNYLSDTVGYCHYGYDVIIK